MARICWNQENNQIIASPRMDVIKDEKNNSIKIYTVSPVDQVPIKHSKHGGPLQVLKEIFLEYLNESSIHGFKYIADQKRRTFDRFLWLCAFILSFLMCCYLVKNISNKREITPVIVTFNEKPTHIWEIPFPTVTICPETKSKMKVFNFTDIFWKLSENESISEIDQFHWEAISQVCLAQRFFDEGNFFTKEIDLIKALLHASRSNEFLLNCEWRNEPNSCGKHLFFEFTEEGTCFTFNTLKANQYRSELRDVFEVGDAKSVNWDFENGYRIKPGEEANPLRAIGTGPKEGLYLQLRDYKEDQDTLCRKGVQGYKLILQTPGEKAKASTSYINLQFDSTISLSITPEIIIASEELRNYEPKRRQCYFQDEGYLRYFKFYSQVNCELECLSNLTLKTCGCVKFSMPKNASHVVCGARSNKCIVEVENKLTKSKLANQAYGQVDDILCNCLPTCRSIKYKAELNQNVPLDIFRTLNAYKREDWKEGYQGAFTTELFISYKDDVFNALKRSELYSTTDLLANCGGLMGLFMGVSLLSLVELVYFFTIRLCAYGNTKYRQNPDTRTQKLHRNRILGQRKLHQKKALTRIHLWKTSQKY